jgi:hypothetical protein
VLAVAAGILVIGAFAVEGNRFLGASRELAAALAETDRLDPGWRFEDLEAQRQLPPDRDNAALQVIAVGSSLQRYWNYQPIIDSASVTDVLRDLPPEKQLDERQERGLRAHLERARPAIDPARKLADMPEGRYPVTWAADAFFTSCPGLDALRLTRPLLELDALLRNESRDPDGALISARALLNVGRSLGDEPFFGGPLYRSVCRHDAARAVERTVAQGQPSESALAAVQESFAREETVSLVLLYFRGERASMHVFLTQVDEGRHRISELGCVPTRGLEAHAETWFGRRHALQIHARYLRDMNEAVEIAKRPLEQQHPLYRQWRRRKGDVENVGDGFRLEGWHEDALLRDHALLRCAVVAVAAERYRLAHGDWPRAIADLVPGYLPAVPLDPFDDAPLRYRRTDSGAVIYSVGVDGRDDGGDPNPPPNHYLPRDVVFTLWNVALRRQPPLPPSGKDRDADLPGSPEKGQESR